jgi:hypothetical protein
MERVGLQPQAAKFSYKSLVANKGAVLLLVSHARACQFSRAIDSSLQVA